MCYSHTFLRSISLRSITQNFALCDNKTGTSKVGAIPKAEKAQFLKYAQEVFMKNSEKSFEIPQGRLSCSENASKVRILHAGTNGSGCFRGSALVKRNIVRI